jgi:hypothetical protein
MAIGNNSICYDILQFQVEINLLHYSQYADAKLIIVSKINYYASILCFILFLYQLVFNCYAKLYLQMSVFLFLTLVSLF